MAPAPPAGASACLTRPISERLGRFGGACLFPPEDLALLCENLGCGPIHTHQQANMALVRARAPTGGPD